VTRPGRLLHLRNRPAIFQKFLLLLYFGDDPSKEANSKK
jgi:hypothetical protein